MRLVLTRLLFFYALLFITSCSTQESVIQNNTLSQPEALNTSRQDCYPSCATCISNSRFGCSTCQDGHYLTRIFECAQLEPIEVSWARWYRALPPDPASLTDTPQKKRKILKNKQKNSRNKPEVEQTSLLKQLSQILSNLWTSKPSKGSSKPHKTLSSQSPGKLWLVVQLSMGTGKQTKTLKSVRFLGTGGFQLTNSQDTQLQIYQMSLSQSGRLHLLLSVSQVDTSLHKHSQSTVFQLASDADVLLVGCPADATHKILVRPRTRVIKLAVTNPTYSLQVSDEDEWSLITLQGFESIPWNKLIFCLAYVCLVLGQLPAYFLLKFVQFSLHHGNYLVDGYKVPPQSLNDVTSDKSGALDLFLGLLSYKPQPDGNWYTSPQNKELHQVFLLQGWSCLIFMCLFFSIFSTKLKSGWYIEQKIQEKESVWESRLCYCVTMLAKFLMRLREYLLQPIMYEFLTHSLYFLALTCTGTKVHRSACTWVANWWFSLRICENLYLFIMEYADRHQYFKIKTNYKLLVYSANLDGKKERLLNQPTHLEGSILVMSHRPDSMDKFQLLVVTPAIGFTWLLLAAADLYHWRTKIIWLGIWFVVEIVSRYTTWEHFCNPSVTTKIVNKGQEVLFGLVWLLHCGQVVYSESPSPMLTVLVFIISSGSVWVNSFWASGNSDSMHISHVSQRLGHDLFVNGVIKLSTRDTRHRKPDSAIFETLLTSSQISKSPVVKNGVVCGHYTGQIRLGFPCGSGYYVDVPFTGDHQPTVRREYEGGFAFGKPHGNGVLRVLPRGANRKPVVVYEGSWAYGNFEGYGRLRLVSQKRGEMYTSGFFRQGKREGPHLIDYRDGGVEFAEFRAGKFHGYVGQVSPRKNNIAFGEYSEGKLKEGTDRDLVLERIRLWSNKSLITE